MKTIARRVSIAALVLLAVAAAAPARAQSSSAPDRRGALEARLAAAVAPSGGLTADEVAARSAATSFDVQARRAEVEASAAAVDQAIIGFFPRVTLTARYMRLSPIADASLGTLVSPAGVDVKQATPLPQGTQLVAVPFTIPSLSNQTVLQANITVPISDYVFRLAQGYSAASRSVKAAELNERAAKLKAAQDGRVAYYTWARARLSAIVAQQALEQSRAHLADVRAAYEAGAASKADVMRVEAQVAAGELVAQRASGFARTTEESVRTAMHDPSAPGSLALGEDLRAPLAPLGTARDTGPLLSEAIANRPEIRALDETAWSLRDQARIARAGYFPRIDALGQVAYNNPEQRVFPPTQEFRATWAVGGQVTWTLNDIGIARAQANQIDAKKAQIEAQRAQLADGLRNEVTQAAQAVEDAEVAIATSERALAAAEESYRVRRELFQHGRASSVELTDAETELFRASLDVVNARVDVRIARARLLHATGRDALAVK
ncbi:outer membrane efflux protein [Minicystis rosea]|nr:outer membrane efflux protein [Minicystis rosea]